MSSDPSTVRAMLVLLEQRGLVERDTHPTDARADGRPHGGGGADVSATLDGGGADPGEVARRASARRGGNARWTPGASRRGAQPGVGVSRRIDFLSPSR